MISVIRKLFGNWKKTSKLVGFVLVGMMAGSLLTGQAQAFVFGSQRQVSQWVQASANIIGLRNETNNLRIGSSSALYIDTTASRVGIGTILPTAALHLKAGTNSANAAPLKFTAGSNLDTAEAGAMEFDGTNLYFTPAALRKTIAFTDSNITGNAATATNLVGLTASVTNLNSVTGLLGTAAFTASTDYATAAQGTLAANALPASSFTDAAVTGKLITGYSSSAGTVAATDTILQAINKLNGNTELKAPIASPTFTGTVAGITAAMVGLGNVTNESKATMFASPTFTGTVTIPSPFTLGATSVTASGAELNILDGVTATAAELNKLDGVTATATELNYTDGVTSAIQTQLNLKAPLASPTFTGTITSGGNLALGANTITTSNTDLVSNLNADLLDSQHGSYYSRAATSQNSIYSYDSRSTNYQPQDRDAGFYVDFKTNSTDSLSDGGTYHGVLTFRSYGFTTDLSGGYPIQIGYTANGNLWTRMGTSGTAWGSWTKLWNDNNDGTGSGLDADLLDGQQGSYYAPLASPTFTGTIAAAAGTFSSTLTANGTLDANGAVTLGDNGDNVTIDSNVWNVSGAGVASGFTGITSSGSITLSGLTASRFVTSGTGGLLGTSAALASLVASISDVSGSTGTTNLVLSASPTFTGTITAPSPPIVAAITSATSGAINLPQVTVPYGSFATFLHGSTFETSKGYIDHISIGDYRDRDYNWGSIFFGIGGNDSYPTSYFLMRNDGVFSHSSGGVNIGGTLTISSPFTLGATSVTASGAELNILDGVTATAAELNKLDGVTATATELNYTDGVTSAIQTQLNLKAPLASPTFTGNVTMPGTGIWNSSGHLGIGTATAASKLQIGTDTVLQQWSGGAPYVLIQGMDNEVETIGLQIKDENQTELFRVSTLADGGATGGKAYFGGSVGIGTTDPGAIGAKVAIQNNTDGVNRILTAMIPNLSGTAWFGLGRATSGYDSGWIGFTNVGAGSASNYMTLALFGVDSILNITGYGRVGLGIVNPSYQLQVSTDSAGKPNGGTWANSSDVRLKTNIATMSGALDKLTRLRGVNFNWKNQDEHLYEQGLQGGFIAQEVEMVFPNWVKEVDGIGKDGILTGGKTKSLSLPFEFDALLVEAIKEQQGQIEELKLSLNNLGLINSTSTMANLSNAADPLQWLTNGLQTFGMTLRDGIASLKEVVAAKFTGDEANIRKVQTEQMTARQMCVAGVDGETVCLTKDQLKDLIARAGSSVTMSKTYETPASSATSTDSGQE